jgi:predicted lipoprotein
MKFLKYILLVAVVGLLGYNSVYFKKLSEVKATGNEKFDAVSFAKKLWDEKLPEKINTAVELPVLMQAVTKDKEVAFTQYSNALGIGNYRYSLVKATGTIADVNEDEAGVLVNLPFADSITYVTIATEYIYGNAIRDASGLVDVKDFPNSTDLNSISEEINKLVKKTVLPAFKTTIKKGDKVNIVGAVELNKEHIKWNGLELIPVRLQIVQ